jgi:phosphatidate cytidylyltransferase
MVARLTSAIVGLPILAVALWIGLPWLAILAALFAAVGAWELSRLATMGGARSLLPMVPWAIALTLNGAFQGTHTLLILGAGLLLSLTWLLLRRTREGALTNWALTVGGALYIGLPLSHGLLLRLLDQGREWLFFALAVTFATDAAAYFTGRLLGRHHMAPSISPKKTWEGAVGGLVVASGMALGLTYLFSLPIAPWHGALFGAAVSIAGQTGDLAQSALKRAVGAKEAGRLIPGHGGFLDRFDSIAFTLILMYYLVVWAT